MLRRADNAEFERLPGLIGRYRFVAGNVESQRVWSTRGLRRLLRAQTTEPVAVLRDGERTWWMWRGDVVWERDGLSVSDVRALLSARDASRERRLQRVRAEQEADAGGSASASSRGWIPREVRRVVWERDGGCCAVCGSAFDLQYDHVIPVALGGSSDAANLQVLCAPCNRSKGAQIA